MFKKKELLIIFVLAVLITFINFYYFKTQGFLSWKTFPFQVISGVLLYKTKVPSCLETEKGLVCPTVIFSPLYYLLLLVFDFLLWFLILTIVWKVVKWIKKIK